MTDLVLAGPDQSGRGHVGTRSEPYQWVPGDDYDTGAITYALLLGQRSTGCRAGRMG